MLVKWTPDLVDIEINRLTEVTNLVECRYNAVQYIMILHTTIQRQEQNINKISKSQKTPHITPLRASYRVSVVRILQNIDRVIKAPYCIARIAWHDTISAW